MRSGIIPYLLDLVSMMRFAGTRETCELTGLTVEVLREWTIRRGLIPADVLPRAKGSQAQYAWQTVLILRLATTLRNRFHVELQAHRTLFAELKGALQDLKPSDLMTTTFLLAGDGVWTFVKDLSWERSEALTIHLKPHLEPLVEFFNLPNNSVQQIELFATTSIVAERKEPASIRIQARRKEVLA
jgi:hypothetical protein